VKPKVEGQIYKVSKITIVSSIPRISPIMKGKSTNYDSSLMELVYWKWFGSMEAIFRFGFRFLRKSQTPLE